MKMAPTRRSANSSNNNSPAEERTEPAGPSRSSVGVQTGPDLSDLTNSFHVHVDMDNEAGRRCALAIIQSCLAMAPLQQQQMAPLQQMAPVQQHQQQMAQVQQHQQQMAQVQQQHQQMAPVQQHQMVPQLNNQPFYNPNGLSLLNLPTPVKRRPGRPRGSGVSDAQQRQLQLMSNGLALSGFTQYISPTSGASSTFIPVQQQQGASSTFMPVQQQGASSTFVPVQQQQGASSIFIPSQQQQGLSSIPMTNHQQQGPSSTFMTGQQQQGPSSTFMTGQQQQGPSSTFMAGQQQQVQGASSSLMQQQQGTLNQAGYGHNQAGHFM